MSETNIYFTAINRSPIDLLRVIAEQNPVDQLLKRFLGPTTTYSFNLVRLDPDLQDSYTGELKGFNRDILLKLISRANADPSNEGELITIPIQTEQKELYTSRIFNALDSMMKIGKEVNQKIQNPTDKQDTSAYSRAYAYIQELQASLTIMLEHIAAMRGKLQTFAIALAERWDLNLEAKK